MNRHWQVLKTYLLRPRFWLLVPIYLLVGPFASVCVGALLACFLGLHMRRQFGTAAAKLMPGFTPPHLTIAAAVSLAMWAGVPAAQAWWFGLRIDSVVAIHAPTGILLALVAIWPRSIVLVVLAPMWLAWLVSRSGHETYDWLQYFALHGRWTYSVPLIVSAVVIQAVASWFLLRLNDQSAVNDDLASDLPKFEGTAGRVENWLLDRRDAVVQRDLGSIGRGIWSIRRWRVPVAIAWPQLAVFPLAVLIVTLSVRSASSDVSLVIFSIGATAVVFLFAPLAPWRGRRHWIAMEVTRPVTRDQYFCELAIALAMDMALWFAVVAIVSGVAISCFANVRHWSFAPEMAAFIGALAGISVFLFGLGLLTLRNRYWFAVLVLVSILYAMVSMLFVTIVVRIVHPPVPMQDQVVFWSWAGLMALFGLAMASRARWRWSKVDLT